MEKQKKNAERTDRKKKMKSLSLRKIVKSPRNWNFGIIDIGLYTVAG